jgi:hypothetical protein
MTPDRNQHSRGHRPDLAADLLADMAGASLNSPTDAHEGVDPIAPANAASTIASRREAKLAAAKASSDASPTELAMWVRPMVWRWPEISTFQSGLRVTAGPVEISLNLHQS